MLTCCLYNLYKRQSCQLQEVITDYPTQPKNRWITGLSSKGGIAKKNKLASGLTLEIESFCFVSGKIKASMFKLAPLY